jgi:RIO kinase 1
MAHNVSLAPPQSVEHDHPNALEFLRRDAANITDYFGKQV